MRLQMDQREIEDWWKKRDSKVPDSLRNNTNKDTVNLQYFELNGPMMVTREKWNRSRNASLYIPSGEYMADLAPYSTEWKFLVDSLVSVVASYVIVYALSYVDFGLEYTKPSLRGQLSLSFLALSVVIISIFRFIASYARDDYQWKISLVTGFFTFIISFVLLAETNTFLTFSPYQNYLSLLKETQASLSELGFQDSLNISFDVFRVIVSLVSGILGALVFYGTNRAIKSEKQGYICKTPPVYKMVSKVNTLLTPLVVLSMWFAPTYEWLIDNKGNMITENMIRLSCIALHAFYLISLRMDIRAHFEMAYHVTFLILSQPMSTFKAKRGNTILTKLVYIITRTFIIALELVSYPFLQIVLLSFSHWIADFLFLMNTIVFFLVALFSRFDSHAAYRL